MDTNAHPMSVKDTLDIVTKVAQLILATIAVSPFIHKAMRLIRTEPPMSPEEREERIRLFIRMGWGQLLWENFLQWARREPDLLTWKERRARLFVCPFIRGHRGEVGKWGGDRFGMKCERCGDVYVGETEELVKTWRKKGREVWKARNHRQRVDEDTTRIEEFASKLADALNRSVSGPR